MAFCNKCGTQVNEGTKFCVKCGTPVALTTSEFTQERPQAAAGTTPHTGAAEAPRTETINQLQKKPGNTKRGLIVAIVLGVIGIVISNIAWFVNYDTLSSQYSDVFSISMSYRDTLESSKAVWVVTIPSLAVGNLSYRNNGLTWITEPGQPLSSAQMQYLCPVATVNSNITGDVTFQVKIKKPDGTHISTAESPNGFTYSQTNRLNYGENQNVLIGSWGDSESSKYPAGQYTVEIWLNGFCLVTKSVTINQ